MIDGDGVTHLQPRASVMNTDRSASVVDQLRACRVVPVVVLDEPDAARHVAEALRDGGITCIEITFRRAGAAAAIRAAADVDGMLVGAGTVLSQEQADLAVEAGARFAVAPASRHAVISHCQERGLPFFPGIATPTELDRAVGWGLELVKVFPAAQLGGPGFLRALAADYPTVGFIPTGGIDPRNLADYLAVPSVAACGGSWLVPADAVADRDYRRITRLAAEAVEVATTKDPTPA
jgi:2-dehydro-3-deoxyphosphogluconate aldolase/(4S)-4-hydroxy-2-oxoglutarate aldolase